MSKADVFGTTARPRRRSDSESLPIPTLTIAAHPDTSRIGDRVPLTGREHPLSRTDLDFTRPGRALGKPLSDPFLSRKPILLEPDAGGGLHLARGTCSTEVVVNGSRLGEALAIDAETVARGVPIVLADRIVLYLHHGTAGPENPSADHGLIGAGKAMIALRLEIDRVADLTTEVLLRGPSGSGKELVANAIHKTGSPGKPFVSVNMGAIPGTIAAAELFGSVRGAFTGSVRDRPGYFRAAHGGTLFLDEIGETPPEVQVLLLRVLETGEITPVGAASPVRVKVRLIAATDADLEASPDFKLPLLHRLSGYPIRVPALAERREDLGALFMHFARAELSQIGRLELLAHEDPYADPWLPAQLMARLLAFDWPGNVRQLRNVVRQLVIGSREASRLRVPPGVDELLGRDMPPEAAARRRPAQIPADELVRALEAHQWDIKSAAATLGISRGSLYSLIEKTPGIRKAGDLAAAEIDAALTESAGDPARAAEVLRVSELGLRRRIKELGIQV